MNLTWLANLIVPQAFAKEIKGCDPSEPGIDLGTCLKLDDIKTVGQVYNSPATLVNLIVRNLFVVGGVIFFIMIIYSGFLFIQGGVKGRDQAKTVLSTATAGFMLMFAAYWVVRIVQIIIGQKILL